MRKLHWRPDFDYLTTLSTPAKTSSYTPISHLEFVNEVRETLDRKNLRLKSSDYLLNNNGTQMIANFDLLSNVSENFGFRISIRNSTDKSLSAALVGGSNVWICSNGCIYGEEQVLHRHTGKVKDVVYRKLNHILNDVETLVLNTEGVYERYQEELPDKVLNTIVGKVIMKDIVSPTQINVFKDEFKLGKYGAVKSKWNLYNSFTRAFKQSNPSNYIERHKQLFEVFENV